MASIVSEILWNCTTFVLSSYAVYVHYAFEGTLNLLAKKLLPPSWPVLPGWSLRKWGHLCTCSFCSEAGSGLCFLSVQVQVPAPPLTDGQTCVKTLLSLPVKIDHRRGVCYVWPGDREPGSEGENQGMRDGGLWIKAFVYIPYWT